MIPHERSLVERLKDEPFALIGINTDKDLDEYRAKAVENGVTWRSAWDGSTRGPLCTAWGINSFPTILVLDAEGVIRYEGVREKQMDEAVDALLAELKEKRPGTRPPSREPDDPRVPVGLNVGQRAPDFTTKDAEGVEFKLSDYRGKVVVVDFWGFW